MMMPMRVNREPIRRKIVRNNPIIGYGTPSGGSFGQMPMQPNRDINMPIMPLGNPQSGGSFGHMPAMPNRDINTPLSPFGIPRNGGSFGRMPIAPDINRFNRASRRYISPFARYGSR